MCSYNPRDVEPGPARHEGGWQLIRTDDGQLLTVPALQQYAQRARAPDSTAVA